MKIKKEIPINIYDTGVELWLCTPEEARKAFTQKFSEVNDCDFEMQGGVVRTIGVWPILYINSNLSKNKRLSTTMHELVHVIDHIFQDIGIDHDYNNDEPFAYFMSFLVSELQQIKGFL